MTIAEILERVPQAAHILSDFQLGCAHCAMGAFETLRDGVLGHGMRQKELESIVTQLNEIASRPRVMMNIDGVQFTEEAYDMVQYFKKQDPEKRENLALRITVHGKKDPEYFFDLVVSKKDGELEIGDKNMRLFLDKKSHMHMKKHCIDYIESNFGAGFKVLPL